MFKGLPMAYADLQHATYVQGDHTLQHTLPNGNRVKPWPKIVEKDGHVWKYVCRL